jgi:hypothetical protein
MPLRTVVTPCSLGLLLLGLAWPLPGRADEAPAKHTPPDLDALIAQELSGLTASPTAGDEIFLRRASLDLIGRPPTVAELSEFVTDASANKRAKLIDRLLESKEFGSHWANYWSDTISFRVPPPELTFLSYKTFKAWLADRFNANAPWDEITRDILTASGAVKDNPAATYVGYHRGHPAKLAAETARVFLGIQLQCAECHNHKFDRWKRKEFHQLAAFFARTSGALGSTQDGSSTVVKDKGKGEYEMPHASNPRLKGTVMVPTFLTGESFDNDKNDTERREFLAKQITRPDNRWFAKAFVNRVWSRLLGRGFYEPVDDMADYRDHFLPKLHDALAAEFVATNYDIKVLFRLIMNTQAYQRHQALGLQFTKESVAPPIADKLRGEQVFTALGVALGLANVTPPAVKATGAYRFPPPPKNTCEVVADKFSFDPSYAPEEVNRTLSQAMLLMNHEQIQAQINADPKSGTLLSKLLAKDTDDRTAVVALFQQVLSRRPTEKEITIALEHVAVVGQRGPAFEDLLWSLINTAEFTTRR